MLWGLDSAVCPSSAALSALRADGWSFFGGYVGGISRSNASYNDGVTDGNDALVAMQSCGLSGRITLDIETEGGAAVVWDRARFLSLATAGFQINAFWVGPGGIAPRDWVAGFVSAAHAGSCSVGLYGTAATLIDVGDLVDGWYLAFWAGSPAALAAAPPDFDQWQFADGNLYDYSVARNDAVFASYQA